MSSGMDKEEAMMSTHQPHLYIILDDWEHGYKFRKVDLPSHAPGLTIPDEGIARSTATCLPAPFFRLKADHGPRGLPYYFTATGSKIWSMHPKEEGSSSLDSGGVCFDVHAQTSAFVPRHTDQLGPVYFHIGDRLFTLGSNSFESLDIGVKEHPSGVATSWSDPVDVPVDSMDAISHAVSSDGRTIFVSMGFVPVECTFSLHLSEDGSSLRMCKQLGEWVLPFHGTGHFDAELNTWIGLSLYREKPGHICSCDLASVDSSQCAPDVKYTEDSLFTVDPDEKHVGATLVCMGHGSKFCLVECVTVVNESYEGPCSSEDESSDDEEDTDDYMLRLTTFSLEYSSNGDLTTGNRRVRYYKMPKHISTLVSMYPPAFWM